MDFSSPLKPFKAYNPRQKSWHSCPLFQYLSRQFISSSPSPQFNIVYRDEVVIARFQHCQGGRGFLIPVIPLDIVSKIACQRMFQLSDPGVPRTFVEDCSFYMQKWIRFKMVSHERQAAYKQKWRMEDVLWRKNAIVLSLVS